MTQLAQGFGLYLPDALAVNLELTATETDRLDGLSRPRPLCPHSMLALNVHGR
jgi:hypothetical protein